MIAYNATLQFTEIFIFLQEKFPNLPVFDVFYRFYPYKLFLGREGRDAVQSILDTFAVSVNSKARNQFMSKISNVEKKGDSSVVTVHRDGEQASLIVRNFSYREGYR